MQETDINYYEIIAANIKILRQKEKLSQEKFAETIGCSREYISRLENNKEKISLALLLQIAKLYNTSPTDFFKNK